MFKTRFGFTQTATTSFLALASFCMLSAQSRLFETQFERSDGLETATYREAITFYKNLAKAYPEISIDSIGETDSGEPLHFVTLNGDMDFNFSNIRTHKRLLLINNGIHPGESDGIDATMMLFRDFVQGKISIPKHTVVVTIPIYNVGGSLNRNSTSRTNQNGPKAYGFRGNARHYDLNRDFIKCDTKNAQAFTELYHLIKPDVFIDTHVSNGADYQYTLTHLFTQHNKIGGELGHYMHTRIMPKLVEKLIKKQWDITPYVNVFNESPDKGFSQFLDYPRYSTGYTTLFNTLGMMVETHMLKPYKQRVTGTYELIKSMIEITEEEGQTISALRKQALQNFKKGNAYPLDWELDTATTTPLNFKGYEAERIKSAVTGQTRLKYHRERPYIKTISYQNYYAPRLEIPIPSAYVIPQAWQKVINLLKLNQIEMTILEQDTVMPIEAYKIKDFETVLTPFEGHYLHFNTSTIPSSRVQSFRTGDVIVHTNQPGIRYIMETLEPMAPDSFFNWNFFDTILQQKEHFSPYVWEDKALALLNHNGALKRAFEEKKLHDKSFSEQGYAQLDWLHKQSEHYEKEHMEYPIYRIVIP